jgi:hypothetical protein
MSIESETTQELENSGVRLFTLKTTQLKPEGFMEESEAEIFNKALNGKIEDLSKLHITNKFAELFLKGTVASGDLEKFKFIIDAFFIKEPIIVSENSYYSLPIVEYTIQAAKQHNISEDDTLKMLKFLIEEKSLPVDKEKSSEYLISSAASKGYYDVAQYLFDYGVTTKKTINQFNLYDLEGKKNSFQSFKWLLDHGASIQRGLVGKIICNNSFNYNLYKHKAFDSQKNIDDTVDFFIKIGVTNQVKVNEISQNCDKIVRIHEISRSLDNLNLFKDAINNGSSKKDIEFLVEQGVRVKSDAIYHLVNYPYPEMVQLIIDELKEASEKIYDTSRIVNKIQDEMDYNYCQSNKIIAEFAGVMGDDRIDWSGCAGEL